MIDTVFFLLIFFMVASLALTRQSGIEVNLPRSAAASRESLTKVTVSLTPEGKIYLEKRPVELSALRDELRRRVEQNPKLAVVIAPDRSVRVERLVQVMDQAKLAGAAKLAIATREGKR